MKSPYEVVLRGSLIQALACGLVLVLLGFSRTAVLSAALITFVAVWLGFLCARLIIARHGKVSDTAIIVMTVIAGSVVGSASALAFCCAIEVFPFAPFLLFGAWVGVPLGLLNVRSWRHRALV